MMVACTDGPSSPATQGPFEYDVRVGAETFVIRATTPSEDSALTRRWRSGISGVITGQVSPGNGGFNGPWHWHLHPETVRVVDVTIEWCDGTPSMVEAAMLRSTWPPGYYCPWGAKIVGRRTQTSPMR